jgi:hypothetical protein
MFHGLVSASEAPGGYRKDLPHKIGPGRSSGASILQSCNSMRAVDPSIRTGL